MTKEVMERIFDPYFTTKKIGEGSGLGLAVVQGIVKSHGGEIKVESEYGDGSAFHVYIPRIKDDMTEDAHNEEPLLRGRERVLFVD